MESTNSNENINAFRPADPGYNSTFDSGYHSVSDAGYNSASDAASTNPSGTGYNGTPAAGYRGASTPGYNGAPGAGFRGPSGTGYNGAPGAGYNNASGTASGGPSGTGYNGAPGAGYRGAPTPGYNATPGAGFRSPAAGPGYMDPPPRNPSSVQAEIKRTRHKKEVPLYIVMIVLGLLTCLVIFLHDISGDGLMAEIREILKDTDGLGEPELNTLVSTIFFATSIIFGIGSLLLFFIIALISVFKLYADQMSYSIRVSERNFPEIYAKVREYTWLLGWKKEPEVYVQQMNGQINAFSSWIPGKIFVQLNAEVVDLAYMEHKDFDTIYFIMAHEFGHAYLHHVQLYYSIWPLLVTFIPFIGSSILYPLLSRSREYSCDRVAQALTGGVAQEDCMMMLGAGRHVYKYINSREYIRDISMHHGPLEYFARWCTNLVASHPIMPFRVNAILDPSKKSGRLL